MSSSNQSLKIASSQQIDKIKNLLTGLGKPTKRGKKILHKILNYPLRFHRNAYDYNPNCSIQNKIVRHEKFKRDRSRVLC